MNPLLFLRILYWLAVVLIPFWAAYLLVVAGASEKIGLTFLNIAVPAWVFYLHKNKWRI